MSDPSQGTLEVESLVLSESDGVLWVMECQGPFLFRDVPSLFVIIQNSPYLRIPWSHLSSPPLDSKFLKSQKEYGLWELGFSHSSGKSDLVRVTSPYQ